MNIPNDNNYSKGDVVFIFENYDTTRAKTTLSMSKRPGAKNMSKEDTLIGWLGETNNISKTAKGVGVIISESKDGTKCRVRRYQTKAEIIAACTALGHPNLYQ